MSTYYQCRLRRGESETTGWTGERRQTEREATCQPNQSNPTKKQRLAKSPSLKTPSLIM